MFTLGGRRLAAAAVVALTVAGVSTGATVRALDASGGASWSGTVSEPDATNRLVPLPVTADAATRTIAIDLDDRHQTWRGTGAALTDSSVQLLAGRADAQALLFDDATPAGARLDLLRLPLSATDFSTEWWTWDWNKRRGVATPPAPAIAAIELASELDTVAGGLEIVATPWTAPADMKTSRRLDGGGLRQRNVSDYGRLLTAQVEHLVDAGLPVSALTIVNEPGHSGNYPTMTMTDSQLANVGTDIAPAMDGLGVELWAVDHNWSDRGRVDRVLAAAPGAFDAAAFHCYAGSPDQMAGLAVPAIMTECTGTTDTWASTFAWDARNLVVDAAEAGSTGLLMWNLALDPSHGPKAPGGCENCRGLLTIDPATGSVEPTPEFFTLAHLSRAASPGSLRLGTTDPVDVPAVAFVRPDGSVGVFGHNDTGTDQVIEIDLGAGRTASFAVPAGALFDVTAADIPGPVLTALDIAVDDTGNRWFVSDGATGLVRHAIDTQQAFVCDLARGGSVVSVGSTDLSSLPVGAPRPNVDCIIRAPEGDAHVVNELGLRQWIPDGATWFCEIDRGLEVIQTTRAYVDAVPEGAWRVCT